MRLLETSLEVNSNPVAQVSVKCGLYQGDVLPPLLFSIDLNPLSQIIIKSGYGYKLRNGATISHLLYMDDTKLYTKNQRDMDSLIQLTRIYSNDIRMSFRLDKCVWMVPRRGTMIRTEGAELLERDSRCSGQFLVPGDPTCRCQS